MTAIYSYNDSGCNICSAGPDSSRVLSVIQSKYHAVVKYDTPSSHIKLILGQSALLYHFNGESPTHGFKYSFGRDTGVFIIFSLII